MARRAGLVAAITVTTVALVPASARAVPCADAAVYPGDGAPKAALAQWMAYGASVASMPSELPVMGALVETELVNAPPGAGDSAGFFQMHVGIWNQGEYAGFPDNPTLQLKWFIDQATQARQARVAAGQPDPAVDANDWGAWIADVLRPPEQLRHRYHLRIDEARTLVGPPCPPEGGTKPPPPPHPPPAPPSPPSPPAPVADTIAPLMQLSGARRQRLSRAGAIVLTVRCPAEPCMTSATAAVLLPRTRRALTITATPRAIGANQIRNLRFVLTRSARERVRAALRSRPSVKVNVRVTAIDLTSNTSTQTRTVRLTR